MPCCIDVVGPLHMRLLVCGKVQLEVANPMSWRTFAAANHVRSSWKRVSHLYNKVCELARCRASGQVNYTVYRK